MRFAIGTSKRCVVFVLFDWHHCRWFRQHVRWHTYPDKHGWLRYGFTLFHVYFAFMYERYGDLQDRRIWL